MSGRGDGDTGGKIEEFVAVYVLNAQTAAALRHHWIRTGVTGRDEAVIVFDNTLRVRSGQRAIEFWSKFAQNLIRLHGVLLVGPWFRLQPCFRFLRTPHL